MNFIKLLVLFLMILLANFSLIKIDFSKLYKKNSVREIRVIVFLLSLALGYLVFECIMLIYQLSLNMY